MQTKNYRHVSNKHHHHHHHHRHHRGLTLDPAGVWAAYKSYQGFPILGQPRGWDDGDRLVGFHTNPAFKTSLQDFIFVLRGKENLLAVTQMTNTNIHNGPDPDARHSPLPPPPPPPTHTHTRKYVSIPVCRCEDISTPSSPNFILSLAGDPFSHFFVFFCVPQLYLWGSSFSVRFVRMWPFFNPTIEVAVFVDSIFPQGRDVL